jgi:hypothetical protein
MTGRGIEVRPLTIVLIGVALLFVLAGIYYL